MKNILKIKNIIAGLSVFLMMFSMPLAAGVEGVWDCTFDQTVPDGGLGERQAVISLHDGILNAATTGETLFTSRSNSIGVYKLQGTDAMGIETYKIKSITYTYLAHRVTDPVTPIRRKGAVKSNTGAIKLVATSDDIKFNPANGGDLIGGAFEIVTFLIADVASGPGGHLPPVSILLGGPPVEVELGNCVRLEV